MRHSQPSSENNSAADTLNRFSTEEAAQKYNNALVGTKKHLREESSVEQALQDVPANAHVLDFPCGTGRLSPLLHRLKFRVTCADSSFYMAALAREGIEKHRINTSAESVRSGYAVSNILKTAFIDDAFDAVVCNRLFHHFYEPHIRRQALAELRRICRGTLVVSYYTSLCLDAGVFVLKNKLRGQQPTDRVPISPQAFSADAQASGLKITKHIPSRPYVSMQTYALLERT